ncbi:hypothetical protein BGX31_003072 [Mortierella sp. GBA43]|nr:hypothetical protein BGX31_003072 [Mortierella sp. GBA43]
MSSTTPPTIATSEQDVLVDNCKVFEVSDLMGGKRVTISEKSIMTKDNPPKYKFDLVLSTSKRAPASPAAAGKSFRDMFPERYQDMLELLKDPGTVNVAFVFTIHSFQHTVALWAHRILLNKYPRFRELVDVVDNRPVSVPVEGISLTTFCVLLKYLYTGDLELTVDPTQFLICDMSKLQDGLSKDATTTLAVLNESLKQHNAAQFYATWSAKDKVTWSDIFLAADRFEMAELRQLTLDNLIASVDESNAMEILFGVGVSFKEEIYKPVMNYITEHLQDVFSIQTEDPFKRFADHSNCHEVMLELLRLSLSK